MPTDRPRRRSLFGRLLRIVAMGLGGIVAIGLLYLVAAANGTIWQPGGGAEAGAGEHRVVIVWSEIHTDIILPADGLSVDWRTVLFEGTETPLSPDVDWYAFGWGAETFYKNVPTMADMTVGIVAEALFLDETVMHISPVVDAMRIPAVSRVTLHLPDSGLRALEQFILASFETGPSGGVMALRDESYGYGDAFYEARGRYSPLRTCNQWTSEALRLAGVSVGYWTPFSQSIAWALGSDAERARE